MKRNILMGISFVLIVSMLTNATLAKAAGVPKIKNLVIEVNEGDEYVNISFNTDDLINSSLTYGNITVNLNVTNNHTYVINDTVSYDGLVYVTLNGTEQADVIYLSWNFTQIVNTVIINNNSNEADQNVTVNDGDTNVTVNDVDNSTEGDTTNIQNCEQGNHDLRWYNSWPVYIMISMLGLLIITIVAVSSSRRRKVDLKIAGLTG